MESEEAILENENNSNLESESNNRIQLSNQNTELSDENVSSHQDDSDKDITTPMDKEKFEESENEGNANSSCTSDLMSESCLISETDKIIPTEGLPDRSDPTDNHDIDGLRDSESDNLIENQIVVSDLCEGKNSSEMAEVSDNMSQLEQTERDVEKCVVEQDTENALDSQGVHGDSKQEEDVASASVAVDEKMDRVNENDASYEAVHSVVTESCKAADSRSEACGSDDSIETSFTLCSAQENVLNDFAEKIASNDEDAACEPKEEDMELELTPEVDVALVNADASFHDSGDSKVVEENKSMECRVDIMGITENAPKMDVDESEVLGTSDQYDLQVNERQSSKTVTSNDVRDDSENNAKGKGTEFCEEKPDKNVEEIVSSSTRINEKLEHYENPPALLSSSDTHGNETWGKSVAEIDNEEVFTEKSVTLDKAGTFNEEGSEKMDGVDRHSGESPTLHASTSEVSGEYSEKTMAQQIHSFVDGPNIEDMESERNQDGGDATEARESGNIECSGPEVSGTESVSGQIEAGKGVKAPESEHNVESNSENKDNSLCAQAREMETRMEVEGNNVDTNRDNEEQNKGQGADVKVWKEEQVDKKIPEEVVSLSDSDTDSVESEAVISFRKTVGVEKGYNLDEAMKKKPSGVSETYELGKEKAKDNGSELVNTDVKVLNDVGQKAAESDDDVMEVADIKQETDVASASLQLSGDEGISKKVKEESDLPVKDDVVVLDDEGEVVPVKQVKPKPEENGLGIQISAVSGRQHQLHANADGGSSTPTVKSEDTAAASTTAAPKQSKSGKSKIQTCIVCSKVCRCKYNIVRNGDVKHLCDDTCFKMFRTSPGSYLTSETSKKEDPPVKPAESESAIKTALRSKITPLHPSQELSGTAYKTCAVCQLMNVNTQAQFCNWKGLDFCGESCLGKFQGNLNTSCSFCRAYIPIEMRASCCLKIGNDMRPFCKQRCYNDFKKRLRLCSFCQKDLTTTVAVFTAAVGADSKFKEFCSQDCMKKLEENSKDVEIISVEKGKVSRDRNTCAVCKKPAVVKHNVRQQGKTFPLCSDPCLSAFHYTIKIAMNKCDSCGTVCTMEEAQAHFIQYEGQVKRFCSDRCVNTFRGTKRKIVPCAWCKTKKLNFDMIERVDAENMYQLFCSLNCLSLYRVNLQAKSNQAVKCDQCQKVVPAQYHLTMSDATVRNFCSYACVMTFQSQFTPKQAPPVSQTQHHQVHERPPPPQPEPSATVGRGRGRGRMNTRQTTRQSAPSPIPVISSVVSLAKNPGESQQTGNQTPTSVSQGTQSSSVHPSADGKYQVLIKDPPAKVNKNKSVHCRPIMQTKATSCRPHSQNKDTQTDEVPPKCVAMPIPVPIYIPMPTVMYSAPTPHLLPIPVPIPVPMFIPTTRKSANGILKAIKEIVDRIPADPLEAELLMMAEAVASDKKPGDSDSDTEPEAGADDFVPEDDVLSPAPAKGEDQLILKKRDGGGEEDMIQMALRMAEEMSGPMEDLETSVEPVAVNTEPPPNQHADVAMLTYEQEEEYLPPKSGRGRGKRSSRGRAPGGSRPKRQRMERQFVEQEPESQPPPVVQNLEPPADTNYHLKFTYGVNAWRYWVVGKNAQIEKSKQSAGGHRLRTFPTDILKCTTDELNYTLCLFIKEVRKPNGEEYSPDSVYYLCLGIQQYLYENGRIDNIFTDLYFEKFTDILHEVIKTLKPKVNPQGQMLCRIEEEHLWESKQLGAHSPYVLLNTLIYFHTKHFILKTAQEHMSLSFAQILKHWKKGMPVKAGQAAGGKNVSLRFYCLANGKKDGMAARRGKEGVPVYEVTENFDNPLRCPVKLYEFFLSKCPESIKNRNDIFYPVPERSCVPDSPVWYSTQSVNLHTMDKMLARILLVREIQEAHLHAQPIFLQSA